MMMNSMLHRRNKIGTLITLYYDDDMVDDGWGNVGESWCYKCIIIGQ